MKRFLKLLTVSALLLIMCVFEPMVSLIANAAGKYEPAGFQFSGKVFLIGDSTVANYSERYSRELGDRYGWGMKLADYFSNVTVENLAIGGTSSRTFLQQNNYTILENKLGKGDYLFIQFGHNDELLFDSNRCTYPLLHRFADGEDKFGTYTYQSFLKAYSATGGKNAEGKYVYEYFLSVYIKLAKDRGAVPVLVTPVACLGEDGNAAVDGHKAYQQAMQKLGRDSNVPVIDMTAKTAEVYNNLYNSGRKTEVEQFHCYTDASKTKIDNQHLSSAGADMIASLIAQETVNLGLSIGNNRKDAANTSNATNTNTANTNTANTSNTTTTTNTANTVQSSYEPANFKFSGKIYVVGDSTAAAFSDSECRNFDRYGWGMKLAAQYNGVTVTNLACGGASSRNFINTANYATLKNSLGAGDYLFIQFGHCDLVAGRDTVTGLAQNSLDKEGKNANGQYSFEYYLMNYYINLAKDKGAVPVLVTPITYRKADGTLSYSSLESYQKAMIELGKANNIPVIDMTAKSVSLCQSSGSAAVNLYAFADTAKTTHDAENLSSTGAEKIAALIAQETKNLGLTLGTKAR